MTHDDPLDCPACGAALEPRGVRLFCDGCRGVMVTREELGEMLRSIYPDERRAIEQQLSPLDGGARSCPHCRARMDAFTLNHIPIDQCFRHGFWFDRDELVKVLQGKTSAEAFAAEYQLRQYLIDWFEYGKLGADVKRIYLWLRDKRRAAAAARAEAAPPGHAAKDEPE